LKNHLCITQARLLFRNEKYEPLLSPKSQELRFLRGQRGCSSVLRRCNALNAL